MDPDQQNACAKNNHTDTWSYYGQILFIYLFKIYPYLCRNQKELEISNHGQTLAER